VNDGVVLLQEAQYVCSRMDMTGRLGKGFIFVCAGMHQPAGLGRNDEIY
jgi:hypothetical protein